jgi:hypothetical protein
MMTIDWDADDLEGCLEYNNVGFKMADVDERLLTIKGENDAHEWHWIVRLNDGHWAYVVGGCDYTGWDCQSSAEAHVADTRDSAIAQAGEIWAPVFRDMLEKGDVLRVTSEIVGEAQSFADREYAEDGE